MIVGGKLILFKKIVHFWPQVELKWIKTHFIRSIKIKAFVHTYTYMKCMSPYNLIFNIQMGIICFIQEYFVVKSHSWQVYQTINTLKIKLHFKQFPHMYVVQYWCTALYFIEHLHRFVSCSPDKWIYYNNY